MSFSLAYLVSLIPPFLDSTLVCLDKFLLSKYKINYINLTIYSGVFAFLTGVLVLIIKGFPYLDVKTIIILTGSGFVGVIYLLFYYKALTLDEASRVGSLFQLVPAIVLVLSAIFLGEKLLMKQYFGGAIIIFSGLLLSTNKLQKNFLSISINKTFWYMLLACFFSAMVYILFRLGVKQTGFWQTIPFEGLGNGLAALSIFTIYKSRREQKTQTRRTQTAKMIIYLSIGEFVYRLSRFSLYFALSLLPASIVSILLGFQPVFLFIESIILSLFFPSILSEIINKKTVKTKLFAIAGFFVGLCLMFL